LSGDKPARRELAIIDRGAGAVCRDVAEMDDQIEFSFPIHRDTASKLAANSFAVPQDACRKSMRFSMIHSFGCLVCIADVDVADATALKKAATLFAVLRARCCAPSPIRTSP
jgi:hypothetical protein